MTLVAHGSWVVNGVEFMDLSKNLKSLGLTLVLLASSTATAQWNENEAVIRDDAGHEVTITPGSRGSDCDVLSLGKGFRKGYAGICRQRLRQLKRNERVARRNGVASTTSSYTAKKEDGSYLLSNSRARNPNGIYIPQYCGGKSRGGGCSSGPIISSSSNIPVHVSGKRMRFDDYDLEDGLRSCDDYLGEFNDWRDSSDYKKSKKSGTIYDLREELKTAKADVAAAKKAVFGKDSTCDCKGLVGDAAKDLSGCALYGDGELPAPSSCKDLFSTNAELKSQGRNRTSNSVSGKFKKVDRAACVDSLLIHFKAGCAKDYWDAQEALELAQENLDEALDEMKDRCSIASDGDILVPSLEDTLEYGRECAEAVRSSCESLWAQVGDVAAEGCRECRAQGGGSSSSRSAESYVYTDHCASYGEYSQACYSNSSSTGPGQYAQCPYAGAPGCSQQWCTAGMNCTTATGQNMVNAQGQVIPGAAQQQLSPWATAATTIGAVVAQGAFGLAQANRQLWGQRSYYDAVTANSNNNLASYNSYLAACQLSGANCNEPTYTGVPPFAGGVGFNPGWNGIGLNFGFNNGFNSGFNNGFGMNGLNGQFANNGAIQNELMMMQQGGNGMWGGNGWGNQGWGGNGWGNQGWGGNGWGNNGFGFRLPSLYFGVQ
jgi:hypothetical protein